MEVWEEFDLELHVLRESMHKVAGMTCQGCIVLVVMTFLSLISF